MSDVTIIIPCAPSHLALVDRAVASVEAQTVPARHLVQIDWERRGAGWARNAALRQVTTPLVVMLDADDELLPTYVERTLEAWAREGGTRYVYTDWLAGGERWLAPSCPWVGGAWHTVTTLLPTAWALETLFNEQLPGAEDTDFYVRLALSGRCGQRLPEPLLHYHKNVSRGSRSARLVGSPAYQRVTAELRRRYGDKLMPCCGQSEPAIASPLNDTQPGDVLARVLWHGARREWGRVSGRLYPRAGHGDLLYVDPRDVDGVMLEAVEPPAPAAEPARGVHGVMEALLRPVPPPPVVDEAVVPAPDVARVVELARRGELAWRSGLSAPATIIEREPVFALPSSDYPSYRDLRMLIALAGFETTPIDAIDVTDPGGLYIICTPEPVRAYARARAKLIAWQFEYAGDYAENYAKFRGELWASDQAWAAEHNARFVLLGSHPLLREPLADTARGTYDATMLGYMTPRRQRIKNELGGWRWPPDHPGHEGPARHDALTGARMMLHVHQHDDAPYAAPLRYALAAAYGLPVLAEQLTDSTPYGDALQEAPYELLARTAIELRSNTALLTYSAERLRTLLIDERPFRRCVLDALA